MTPHDAFQTLLLLTVLAALVPVALRYLGHWLRLPIVVGEILAGIVVGRSGLNLVQDSPIIEFLAEFGFILLMFLSGLELHLPSLGGDDADPLWRRPGVLAAMSIGATLWHLGMVRNPVLMGLIL